ncbi:MAG: DUF4293 family protein [Arachidicoccus sp.]|nr:DUF4293 family protein [Arachidicoccus sp.]
MIQRIQTLWLFLTAILAALTFKFPFYVGTWVKDNVQHPQISLLAYNPSILVLIATVIIIVIALISIFLYKNRRQQLLISVLNFIISIVLIYLYYNEIHSHFLTGSGTLALTSIFIFLIPILLILAMRGINRDIKLLKRADRLRD